MKSCRLGATGSPRRVAAPTKRLEMCLSKNCPTSSGVNRGFKPLIGAQGHVPLVINSNQILRRDADTMDLCKFIRNHTWKSIQMPLAALELTEPATIQTRATANFNLL
jgi:hypothetical protein